MGDDDDVALQWGHVVVDVEGAQALVFSVSTAARFNGATSSSTWKGNNTAFGYVVPGLLQWGHVVVDVEGTQSAHALRLVWSSFNGATSSSTWKVVVGRGWCSAEPCYASMGPRRRRRGRMPGLSSRSPDGGGFNGATSSSTWKGPRSPRYARPVKPASMGPRRRRRGRTVTPSVVGRGLPKLQWGHVVVDVEGLEVDPVRSVGSVGFNGATSSSTWKAVHCGCHVAALALASMGPRRRRRGRGGGTTTLTLDHP